MLDKMFDSIDRRLGLEKPANSRIIYQYPKYGNQDLWIDAHTKETDYKPWYYSTSLSTDPADVRVIPAAKTRYVIHYVPPEAVAAIKRQQSEEDSWMDDEEYQSKKITTLKKYVVAFVDLLNNIRGGNLAEMEYIIGDTDYRMANLALALGFKRCWEEGYMPPSDLSSPMMDENRTYKVGISVKELKDLYNLENQAPTEESVRQRMKEYNIERHKRKPQQEHG